MTKERIVSSATARVEVTLTAHAALDLLAAAFKEYHHPGLAQQLQAFKAFIEEDCPLVNVVGTRSEKSVARPGGCSCTREALKQGKASLHCNACRGYELTTEPERVDKPQEGKDYVAVLHPGDTGQINWQEMPSRGTN